MSALGYSLAPGPMTRKDDLTIATRASLLEKLRDLEDQASWQRFFDTYSPLIWRVSLKAGLTEAEADDVVQETVTSVARHLPSFHYDPAVCSFKTWMLRMTRWRIIDVFRKRLPVVHACPTAGDDDAAVVELDSLTAGGAQGFAAAWEHEWQQSLLAAALERVKPRVNPETFQMFDLYAFQGLPVREVARLMGTNVARVYLARHRMSALLKKEIAALEKAGL